MAEELEEAENLKELKKYDRTHNWDDPDFFKNRPPVILKKRRVRTRPPLPLRILKTVRRIFDETMRADRKAEKGKPEDP